MRTSGQKARKSGFLLGQCSFVVRCCPANVAYRALLSSCLKIAVCGTVEAQLKCLAHIWPKRSDNIDPSMAVPPSNMDFLEILLKRLHSLGAPKARGSLCEKPFC